MRVQRGLLLLCAVLANGAPPVSGFGDPSDDIPPASRAGSDVAVAIVVILATFAALFFPTILAIFYGITSRWANNPIAAPVPIPVGGDAPAGGEVAAIDAAALQQDHAGHALAPGQHADNEIRLQHAPNDTKIYINSVVNNFRPTLVAEVETVLACFAAPSDGVPVAADQELALQKFAVEKAIEIIRLKSDAEQKLFWQTITSGFARQALRRVRVHPPPLSACRLLATAFTNIFALFCCPDLASCWPTKLSSCWAAHQRC
jgi:hypothetical protein